jgi:hypothetical protein
MCRLDLGELRWEHTSALTLPRAQHACCAVRGGVVVLGGQHARFKPGENEVEDSFTASVEISGHDSSGVSQRFGWGFGWIDCYPYSIFMHSFI